MTQTPTDALRLVPDEKVRELAMQLARSIAGLGYPVGLGVAPPEDVCMKAAQGIFDLYLTAAPASPLPLTTTPEPIPPSTGVADNGASPLPEGGGWQDIITAPKDGTEILIYRDGWQEAPRAKWGDHDGEDDQGKSIVFGGWFMASEWFTYGCEDGFLGWDDDANVMPTHWMPLPAAPTGAK